MLSMRIFVKNRCNWIKVRVYEINSFFFLGKDELKKELINEQERLATIEEEKYKFKQEK